MMLKGRKGREGQVEPREDDGEMEGASLDSPKEAVRSLRSGFRRPSWLRIRQRR